VSIRVHDSEHLVIAVIDIELHGVLVVSEQSVVTIGQISESAALKISNMISIEVHMTWLSAGVLTM
jgi:hypothetical protein